MRYVFWAGAGAVMAVAAGAMAIYGCLPGGRPGGKAVPNAACHVCHIPFAAETLSAGHARKKVWCQTCHGASLRHAADENIGATRPDVVFKDADVASLCAKCHKPDRHPKLAAEKRLELLQQARTARLELTGRAVEPSGACTDCHGTHWIPRAAPATPTQGL